MPLLLATFALPSCLTDSLVRAGRSSTIDLPRTDGPLWVAVPRGAEPVQFFVPDDLVPADYAPERPAGAAGLLVQPTEFQPELAVALRAIEVGAAHSPRCGITLGAPEADGRYAARLHFDWIEDPDGTLPARGCDAQASCTFTSVRPESAVAVTGAVRASIEVPGWSPWVRRSLLPFALVVDVVTFPLQYLVLLDRSSR